MMLSWFTHTPRSHLQQLCYEMKSGIAVFEAPSGDLNVQQNTSHMEASPQEAGITLAGDAFGVLSDFYSS